VTNEELNEACCRFAGIEPELKHADKCEYQLDSPSMGCCDARLVYPSVSTDWGAAEKLSTALRGKGYRLTAEFFSKYVYVRFHHDESDKLWSHAKDFPMAFALAVKALAEAVKP
jgi:hypothetical protein